VGEGESSEIQKEVLIGGDTEDNRWAYFSTMMIKHKAHKG
jgi:hypothetical protein